MAASLRKNPATASTPKYDSSYHNGVVFRFLAGRIDYWSKRWRAVKASPNQRMFAEEKLLQAVTAALIHALSADLCCRGGDLAGLFLDVEGIELYDKRGRDLRFISAASDSSECGPFEVDLGACNEADRGIFRLSFTKTGKASRGHPRRLKRIRLSRTKGGKHMDTFVLLHMYLQMTSAHRCRTPADCYSLLINHKECALRPTFSKVRAKTIVPPCGGTCGHIHAMSASTINSWRKQALEAAGVDVSKYTSHAIRGNAETAMIQAAGVSKVININEPILRAGHSADTYKKSYMRPPHEQWMAELIKHRFNADLTAEEAIRVGGESESRQLLQHYVSNKAK